MRNTHQPETRSKRQKWWCSRATVASLLLSHCASSGSVAISSWTTSDVTDRTLRFQSRSLQQCPKSNIVRPFCLTTFPDSVLAATLLTASVFGFRQFDPAGFKNDNRILRCRTFRPTVGTDLGGAINAMESVYKEFVAILIWLISLANRESDT